MPKTATASPTDWVIANFDTAPRSKWMTPGQVAFILETTPATLLARRGDGKPPPFKKFGAAVRYAVGAVRDFIGGHGFKNTAEARAASPSRGNARGTFAAFMSDAKPRDRWPFMVEVSGKPVEFFHSLRVGVTDEARGEWLTVAEFCRLRLEAVAADQAAADRRALEKKAPPAAGTVKQRPPL